MNLQVDPKPYTLIEPLQIPLKGALTHEGPQKASTSGPRDRIGKLEEEPEPESESEI